MTFTIVSYGSKEWEKAVQLRERVLRSPMGSFFTKEELEEEKEQIHIVGKLNNTIIATAVLVPEENQFKMQRVAVSKAYRNQNIGSQMMLFCEDLAHKNNKTSIYCHARNTAVSFYQQQQYVKHGSYFEEDGIPHLKMIKTL